MLLEENDKCANGSVIKLLVGNNCDFDDNDENRVVQTEAAEVNNCDFLSSYYKLR